jgi:hypothetical protein
MSLAEISETQLTTRFVPLRYFILVFIFAMGVYNVARALLLAIFPMISASVRLQSFRNNRFPLRPWRGTEFVPAGEIHLKIMRKPYYDLDTKDKAQMCWTEMMNKKLGDEATQRNKLKRDQWIARGGTKLLQVKVEEEAPSARRGHEGIMPMG